MFAAISCIVLPFFYIPVTMQFGLYSTVSKQQRTTMIAFARILLAAIVLLLPAASAFSPPATFFQPRTHLYSTSTSSDPSEMKLRAIQSELKNMGVSYADCFDRDSLTRRLLEARNGETPITSCEQEAVAQTPVDMSSKPIDDASSSTFDREATMNELRSLRIKELRTELANRRIQWRSMLEKEELVQALLSARESAHNFSPSGALCPGRVADINADQLSLELSKPASTPLVLDVYATWCGPCQMMSPQLTAAAEELGDSVRVAKIDSDMYPDWASRLRVGGLPTVIVFDGATGNELERVEGALMKDGLVQLAKKHM